MTFSRFVSRANSIDGLELTYAHKRDMRRYVRTHFLYISYNPFSHSTYGLI